MGKRIGILCNPYASSGSEKVYALTREAFVCLASQGEILTGPGELGQIACGAESARVLGQNSSHTRHDTIETVRQFTAAGADLVVVISGDGTYGDAVEGMKLAGRTLPIFGIAAGRFNTIFPHRRYDPFVSSRGVFRPFVVDDLIVEDVAGLVVRVNDEIVSYGFFWALVSNSLASSDAAGDFMLIDAVQSLGGRVVPVTATAAVACERTRIVVESATLGTVHLASGARVRMPIVAPVARELNQIVAGGFGAFAELMGFDGVAYYFTNDGLEFLPTPAFFPVETRSAAFFAGDRVLLSGFVEGSVLQVDSTPVRVLSGSDLLSVEVVRKLGKKARPG